MPEQIWTDVDDYLVSLFPSDPILDRVLESADQADLPNIHVSAAQGRLLSVLARSVEARSILEIGTLAGYCAIWLARTLPTDGHLVTLEADAKCAAISRANLEAAGLAERVTVVEGAALETLPAVKTDHPAGFDFIFIDADKESYPDYWRWALELSHPGTMIVADNVVRDGRVVDSGDDHPQILGTRRFLEAAAAEPGVFTGFLQTVGAKGYDGLSVSVVGQT